MKNNTNTLQPVVRSIKLKTIKGPIDFERFKPKDELNFEIVLEVFVGVEGSKGEERFDVTVCTPERISKIIAEDDYMIGHGTLIVSKYSYDQITERVKSHVKMCIGSTIDDVMRRVGLLGEWESEWEI